MVSKLTSKGQVTIPKQMRDHLNLKSGDTVKWFLHPNGNVVILPTVPVSALRGLVEYGGPSVSIEDMNAAIAEGATRHQRRLPTRRKAA